MRFHGGLDSLLLNTTAVRLIRTLSRFPGREFTGREAALESGASVPASIRELNRFLENGVVTVRRAGNAQLWRWREAHYFTEPLSALFAAEHATLEALRSVVVEALSNSDDVTRVVLYGSVARGDERPGSDIDLLVVVRSQRAKAAVSARLDRLRARIGTGFGNALSTIIYTSEEVRRKNRLPLLENIEREGIVLIERKE